MSLNSGSPDHPGITDMVLKAQDLKLSGIVWRYHGEDRFVPMPVLANALADMWNAKQGDRLREPCPDAGVVRWEQTQPFSQAARAASSG